jgi:lipoprotein-releasing system permease protein
LKQGTLSNRSGGIVVGSELAKRAHLELGTEIKLATQTTEKPMLCRVEGIFSSGMYEYDANLVFLNLRGTQALFATPGAVSGLSIYLDREEDADRIKRELQKKLGYPYVVQSWMDMNRTLFSALKLEKTVMFLILALIIFVACLNIAGCLTILVMNKTKDIGVLKALGARPADLVKIFALDGLALGITGAFSGAVLGMGICWVLKNTSLVVLPKEIYYIDRLPVQIGVMDTSLVLAVAVLLSFVSALYPAIVAGKLDPVKALRYE